MKKLFLFVVQKLVIDSLGGLLAQDKDLLLFGSGFNKFAGNTKSLFEYYAIKDKSYKCYWISNSLDEAKRLRKIGYKSIYKWSPKAFLLVLKTKAIFISHNIKDVFPIIPRRTIVINLWHGTPIKTIGFDSKKEKIWINKFIEEGRTLPYQKWDYFITGSSMINFIFESAMGLDKGKIKPLGLPRTEVIFNAMESQKRMTKIWDNLSQLKSIKGQTKILYTPTFRNNNEATNIIKQSLIQINGEVLEGNDIILLFKPHPLDKATFDQAFFEELSNVTDVSDFDTQELLCISDILITDYSSILFDFMITGKPIISYVFDLEQYIEENGKPYFSFEEIGVNVVRDLRGLVQCLRLPDTLKKDYDASKFNVSKSCEKISDFVKDIAGSQIP